MNNDIVSVSVPIQNFEEEVVVQKLLSKFGLCEDETNERGFSGLDVITIVASSITILEFVIELINKLGNSKKRVRYQSYESIGLDQVKKMLEDDLK